MRPLLLTPALLACVITGVACGPGRAATVSTPEALLAALREAPGGSTIYLSPGDYEGVTISDAHFAAPVTITSADPSRKAVLTGLKVSNSSGLTFSTLELAANGPGGPVDPHFAFRFDNVKDVRFRGLDVHGEPEAEPSTQTNGFDVARSQNVSIEHCRFHALSAALNFNDDVGVVVAHNGFSRLDKGGVEMGGSSDVTIADNDFTDFHVSRSTHPDAIQIFTQGSKASARDIKVTGNLFYRGAGNPVQGVFVQDEVGNLPFINVTIRDNAIIGGMWNSIYLRHATGAIDVEDNIVVSWAGLDMEGTGNALALKTSPTTTNFRAWIWLRGDFTGATITEKGNRAQAYPAAIGGSQGIPGRNAVAADAGDGGAKILREWLASHPDRELFPSGAG